jgi:integrase
MKTSETKKQDEKAKIAKLLPRQIAKAPKSKGHVDRWRKAIYKPARSGSYSVRIMFGGRRVNFPLWTGNGATAASKAADIYANLTSNGWEATLAKFKPDNKKTEVATVGELIAAARKFSSSRESTFGCYERALRTIASEICGIKATNNRYDYRGDGNRAWKNNVDGLTLEKLDSAAVIAWRNSRVAKAGTNPMAQRKATATADSLLRCAKSLFGKKILPHLLNEITIPAEVPFSSAHWKMTVRRYCPPVTPQVLTLRAKEKLKEQHPETYKAFILCLYLGLRKSEADCLTWKQINFETAVVSIRETEHFRPKTEEAVRDIHLPPSVLEVISKMRAKANKSFVLHGGIPRPGGRYPYYRANIKPYFTWKKLTAWLKESGFDSPKPVHDLRKMAGSLIYAAHGLEVARDFLGHNNISTTANSYVHGKDGVMVEIPEMQITDTADKSEQG